MTSQPTQPSFGDQLRADLAVAERRRDDAAQLATALNYGAQLADTCDTLLREKAELEERVRSLEAELVEATAAGGGSPAEAGAPSPGGTPGPDEDAPKSD